MEVKRKRGRPAGSRDVKPRVFRSKTVVHDIGDMPSVQDRIRRLKQPVRISTLAEISGLSESTLRKKIEQGKIHAFKRSGIILIEPAAFLTYWLGGISEPNDPRLFDRRPMNVD